METGGTCPYCDFIENEKLNYRASKENRANILIVVYIVVHSKYTNRLMDYT